MLTGMKKRQIRAQVQAQPRAQVRADMPQLPTRVTQPRVQKVRAQVHQIWAHRQRTVWAAGGGQAPMVAIVTLVVALAAMTVATVTAAAQEALGDAARRIRNNKENGALTGMPKPGQKAMSPATADLSATMALISETDPEKYSEGVRLMLEQERFRVLDDVSNGERTNRTRFAG